MNQVQLIVDIDEAFFDQAGAYQITFQHQYSTELVQDVKTSPKFETNHFDIITVADSPETVNLNVVVEDHQSGEPVIKAKTIISISPSSQFQDKEIVFTDSLTGFLLIKYKTIPATSGRIIRTLHDKDYVLNVTVGYINALMESPYRLKVSLLTPNNHHLHALQLTNTYYHSVSKVSGKYGQEGLLVRIQELDVDHSQVFVTRITNSAPSVVYITLASGDIITVTFKFSDIEHNHVVGIVHSSVMREGSISTGPNEEKPRLSLTPRRRSSVVTPRSSIKSSKVAGALKQLLYLEDESLEEHTRSEEILHRLGGKIAVGQDNPTASTEALQTPTITSRAIEAANGTFIFSTSRSDVIDEENAPKTKHMKRKDMQNIVLGLLKLNRSYVTNPLKLRATLSDVLFLDQPDETNPEKLIRKPRAELRYTGQLVETSREIFSESGLVTCALEGKLYIEQSQLRDENHLRQHLHDSITERIMVFKVILSLIHFDAIDGGDKDDPFKSTADSVAEESTPHLATASIDTILQNAMTEHREKVQQLQEEKFNVITDETAKGDGELMGESEMNLPLGKQKLTPIPSGTTSKEHSNAASKAELPLVESASRSSLKEKGSKHSSNKNSKVSLHPSAEGKEINESEESVLAVPTNSKVSSKHPSNKNSHHSLPPLQDDPQLASQKTSFAELPSLPMSHKPSQEELYALQRNRTGEIEGFSQAFGEGITVEDIIKHRISKQNLRDQSDSVLGMPSNGVEPNKKNIVLFAQMIKEELLEKQRMVDDLLQENKSKYKAIQLVGQDIKQLREENQRLKKSLEEATTINQQYENEKLQATSIFQDYLETGKPLERLSNTTLIHTLAQLYSDHKQLQHQYEKSQELISSEQQRIAHLSKEKDDLQSLHQQLTSNHQQLQRDFQQRSSEFEKLSYYQLTIQTQEKIISKLQLLLESKMKNKFSFLKEGQQYQISPPNGPSQGNNPLLSSKDYLELQQLRAMASQHKVPEPIDQKPEASTRSNSTVTNNNNEYEKLVQEVFEKTNQLQSQQQEIVSLNHKIEDLESQIEELKNNLTTIEEEKNRPTSATSFNVEAYNEVDIQEILERNQYGHRPSSINNLKKANLTVDKLTADNLSKGFKIEALEKQLEASSRESAREIARLRTKLFELEMAAMMAANGITADDGSGFDDTDLLDIASANTSSKTNKTSNTLLSASKPSSAKEKQRPSIVPAITLGRGRNTILEDLEERYSARAGEPQQSLQGKVHDSNPGELVVNVEKPENVTIPSRIPSTAVLRNESIIDIDKIPQQGLQPEEQVTPLKGEKKEEEGKDENDNRDLLQDIMNDIHQMKP